MLTLGHRRESAGSRSGSVQGRRSGEIIEEEEEEEEDLEDDMEVEEVEEFSPVRFGEVVLEEGVSSSPEKENADPMLAAVKESGDAKVGGGKFL